MKDENEKGEKIEEIPLHLKGVMCHKCNKEGHFAKNCVDNPQEKEDKLGLFQMLEDPNMLVDEVITQVETKVKPIEKINTPEALIRPVV